MSNATTNKAAMSAAKHRWIEEAGRMSAPKAAAHLNAAAERVERLLKELGRLGDNDPVPADLQGLTCWDLSATADELRVKAFSYERKVAA